MAGASVYQGRDGVWRARVIFPADPATGRRARKVKAFPGARDAEEARAMADAYAAGASGASIQGALARYAEEVAEKGAAGRAPKANTAHDYLGYARRLGEVFPAVPACEVTPAMVSSVESRLLSRGLSATTVNGYHQFMSGAFSWMARQGWVRSNPAADAIHPSAGNPDASGKALDEEELRALTARLREGEPPAGECDEAGCAMTALDLIACTGMRLGEALALRVRDFRPQVPDVYVCGTVCERGGVFRQPTAKRGGGQAPGRPLPHRPGPAPHGRRQAAGRRPPLAGRGHHAARDRPAGPTCGVPGGRRAPHHAPRAQAHARHARPPARLHHRRRPGPARPRRRQDHARNLRAHDGGAGQGHRGVLRRVALARVRRGPRQDHGGLHGAAPAEEPSRWSRGMPTSFAPAHQTDNA